MVGAWRPCLSRWLHSKLALPPSLQRWASRPHLKLGREARAELPLQAVTAQPCCWGPQLQLPQLQPPQAPHQTPKKGREARAEPPLQAVTVQPCCRWRPQLQPPQPPVLLQQTPQLGRPPGAVQAQPCQRLLLLQQKQARLTRHRQHSREAAVAWQCPTAQMLPTAQRMRLVSRMALQRPRRSLATQLISSATHS